MDLAPGPAPRGISPSQKSLFRESSAKCDKFCRNIKGLCCDEIPRFESCRPSQQVSVFSFLSDSPRNVRECGALATCCVVSVSGMGERRRHSGPLSLSANFGISFLGSAAVRLLAFVDRRHRCREIHSNVAVTSAEEECHLEADRPLAHPHYGSALLWSTPPN
jgi:hypothetical protein